MKGTGAMAALPSTRTSNGFQTCSRSNFQRMKVFYCFVRNVQGMNLKLPRQRSIRTGWKTDSVGSGKMTCIMDCYYGTTALEETWARLMLTFTETGSRK